MRRALLFFALLSSLLSYAVTVPSPVSAGPIGPPSTGCAASSRTLINFDPSYTFGPVAFYIDDTFTFASGNALNVHYTSSAGLNKTISNAFSGGISIPQSAVYTFVFTAATPSPSFALTLGCRSTPLSSGCVAANTTFVNSAHVYLKVFDAGEVLHVTANLPVTGSIIKPPTTLIGLTTDYTYTFPATGVYDSINIESARSQLAQGVLTCGLSRGSRAGG